MDDHLYFDTEYVEIADITEVSMDSQPIPADTDVDQSNQIVSELEEEQLEWPLRSMDDVEAVDRKMTVDREFRDEVVKKDSVTCPSNELTAHLTFITGGQDPTGAET